MIQSINDVNLEFVFIKDNIRQIRVSQANYVELFILFKSTKTFEWK